MLIALVARTDINYEGSVVPAGTRFEATPIAAAVLRYQRLVDFAAPGRTERPPVVAPVPDAAPTPRRRTRTPKADPEADAPADAPRRRTYRRRDLTAETP